ncbi:MAG: MBL fold metallo-hydrolase [Edaphocola sp.]
MATITFLGTGTSQGVPMIGCGCAVCASADRKDKRLRSAVWIKDQDTSVVVDTGPDFRYQMLRAQVPSLDAVIYTHGHKDHIAGLDDVRAYNYWQQSAIDLYADEPTTEVLLREFQYAFAGEKYPGIPVLNLIPQNGTPFSINTLHFQPIKAMHYQLPIYGYRTGNFTYITDANYISAEEIEKIKGSKILVLNALRHEQHISHFTLQQAIEIALEIGAEQTYFTHISHQLGRHKDVSANLPQGIYLAYDGLVLHI